MSANLRSTHPYTWFRQDTAEVVSQDPDLITYNEVGRRQDIYLAPEGYELWRTPGHYPGNTPVAWRTSAWDDVAHGTWQISDYPTRPPGKKTFLGRRYANWVSLRVRQWSPAFARGGARGARFRDEQRRRVDLLRPSVRRLSTLVQRAEQPRSGAGRGGLQRPLSERSLSAGPPHRGAAAANLRPVGNHFPTGDHHGATIDYVFLRGKGQLQVDWHRPVELNSDHDAVVAGLSWTTPAPNPVTTIVRSQPDGTTEERLAVRTALRKHLGRTVAGETVRVATRDLNLPLAYRALQRAEARGVRVQVTTRSTRLTWRERRLLRTLDANGSWLRRCQGACRTEWEQDQPPSLLLVTGADGNGKVRIDVSRRLRRVVVTRATTARITTSRSALNEARAAFAGL